MLDGLDNKMLKQVAKSGTLTGLASAATPGAIRWTYIYTICWI